jgi:hypothetical protein
VLHVRAGFVEEDEEVEEEEDDILVRTAHARAQEREKKREGAH